MPAYRSRTTTHGRNMAGARGLWRATGMKDGDFGKPIIAVVNSFTQFVPGHVHLKDLGQLVAREIEAAGGVAKEFNTIAVDDGIAMGHDGMLYSLPSRDIIADSVEYMVNAHTADAMVCISNCDKITPGMLNAAMRLNIPVVFVSGGPMEAGKAMIKGKLQALDLVDAMVMAADDHYTDAEVQALPPFELSEADPRHMFVVRAIVNYNYFSVLPIPFLAGFFHRTSSSMGIRRCSWIASIMRWLIPSFWPHSIRWTVRTEQPSSRASPS